MSAVLVVARLKVHDPETYARYEAPFLDILAGYDGRLIGMAEPPVALEGTFDGTRLVVLEFANQEELQRWYMSDAYQEILVHRHGASEGDIWMLPRLDMSGPVDS